jgi:hypothetical protein
MSDSHTMQTTRDGYWEDTSPVWESGGAKITIPANYPYAMTISQMDFFWNGVCAGALTSGVFFLIAALLIWARVRNG